MAKIKWRQQDIDRIRKEVQRYNAKIRRMAKQPKYKDITLPKPLKAKDLIGSIETRAEYNRTVNKLGRIFKKGAGDIRVNKYGVKQLVYTVRETAIEFRRAEREAAKALKEEAKIPTIAGEVGETGLTVGEMGDNRLVELQPRESRVDKVKTQSEWDKFVEFTERRADRRYYGERRLLLFNNWKKAVRENLWIYEDEILELVDQYDADTFYFLYATYQDLQIDFIYGPEEMEIRATVIMDILRANLSKSKKEG